jgi:hypothetical protein
MNFYPILFPALLGLGLVGGCAYHVVGGIAVGIREMTRKTGVGPPPTDHGSQSQQRQSDPPVKENISPQQRKCCPCCLAN